MKPLVKWLLRLLVIGILPIDAAVAQSISPFSVNSAGKQDVQLNGSISYTVGETVIQYFTDSLGHSLCSGVIPASNCDTEVTSINDGQSFDVDIFVYPNPTSNHIVVEMDQSSSGYSRISVFDNSGRSIYNEKYSHFSTQIRLSTEEWLPGTYFLQISDMKQTQMRHFKIVKQ